MTKLSLLLMLFTKILLADCPLPKGTDVQEIQYKLERIDASLKIVLTFPQLSKKNCTETKVSFGTLWTFSLPSTEAIELKVYDRNGKLVQDLVLFGDIQIKNTPDWSALLFYQTQWSKPLSDQDIGKLELFNKGSLLACPAIEIKDLGQSRRVQALVTFWP